MYSFSVKSLNLLNNPLLSPTIRLLMTEAIKDSPLDFTVIETVRTREKQIEYIKKGTSKTKSTFNNINNNNININININIFIFIN